MKHLSAIILFLIVLYGASASAQCTLSASDNTEAEVITCLTNCGCSAVVIPNGVTISMANDWDLTGFGAITFTIEIGGHLQFPVNNRRLELAAGSILYVLDTDPDNNAIEKTGGGNGNNRIQIGSTLYNPNDFDEIIEAGGADDQDVLPVDLISFSASVVENVVKLSWITASEINNDYFTLEKSRNGKDFKILGNVSGNGTVNTTSHYDFMDNKPFLGLSYYRLSQTDYDGTVEVFTVISVLYTNGKANFSIYPNPITGRNSFHFSVEGRAKNEEVQLNIINLQGKIMEKIMLRSDQFGIIDQDIQLSSNLKKGSYIFELVSGKGKSYLKVISK